jgi:hypothetical protein
MYSIEEARKFKPYVSSQLTARTPIYNWYTFPHSFSRELVHEMLIELEGSNKTVVFDPFVGAGTTLLACREKKIAAFGIDQLPFSVFTSNVKIRNYDCLNLQSALNTFELSNTELDQFGSVPLVDKAFSPEIRNVISRIYTWITNLKNQKAVNFFLLALLRLLEEYSHTTKSGGWLRIVQKSVESANLVRGFQERAQQMINDLHGTEIPVNRGLWYAMPGDARDKSQINREADLVITSPPYLNRHDYTRIFALEMALHFANSNQDLIQIRKASLRSHVEAKLPEYISIEGYDSPEKLTEFISEVERRVSPRDKKRIPAMLQGYFEDMYMTLDALALRIRRGGKIAFVVSNVRFAGVIIPVDEILAEIGEQVGLTTKKILVARYRGNSSQQMKLYGRKPNRESIVIWQKI